MTFFYDHFRLICIRKRPGDRQMSYSPFVPGVILSIVAPAHDTGCPGVRSR